MRVRPDCCAHAIRFLYTGPKRTLTRRTAWSNLDPVPLARIRFAFTIDFHIVFPAFTIGLASDLAMLEAMWLAPAIVTYGIRAVLR